MEYLIIVGIMIGAFVLAIALQAIASDVSAE